MISKKKKKNNTLSILIRASAGREKVVEF